MRDMHRNQAITELPVQGDPLVDSISEKLEALSSLSTNCCIYRVSIGPLHRVVGPLHHGPPRMLNCSSTTGSS